MKNFIDQLLQFKYTEVYNNQYSKYTEQSISSLYIFKLDLTKPAHGQFYKTQLFSGDYYSDGYSYGYLMKQSASEIEKQLFTGPGQRFGTCEPTNLCENGATCVQYDGITTDLTKYQCLSVFPW